MKINKAFILCAGLGTRFQPQTHFCPKPALPFFNIPQVLYSTSALKEFGVSDFFYNSHHLPEELEKSIKPYFKTEAFFEKELLDSGGALIHLKNSKHLNDENFWILNGDSFISYEDTDFLTEAANLHLKSKALVTLIGTGSKKIGLNGLSCDSSSRFKGLNRNDDSLHFIGLYLLNREILKYVEPKAFKLFDDLLLKPEVMDRVFVYKAPTSVVWSETGNEKDFINCMKKEAQNLKLKKENSFVYRTHKNWGLEKDLGQKLKHFLSDSHWGLNTYRSELPKDFVCVPDTCTIDGSIKLSNSAVFEKLTLNQELSNESLTFDDKLLIHSTQWT